MLHFQAFKLESVNASFLRGLKQNLNCNLLSTECRESKSLTSFYESFNLSQFIAAPTRVTELSPCLFDVILASQTKQVVKTGVMDSLISDHDMVFAVLHL